MKTIHIEGTNFREHSPARLVRSRARYSIDSRPGDSHYTEKFQSEADETERETGKVQHWPGKYLF